MSQAKKEESRGRRQISAEKRDKKGGGARKDHQSHGYVVTQIHIMY